MRWAYRILSWLGDVRSAYRGPGPFVRRLVRKQAHKSLAKMLRRILKP